MRSSDGGGGWSATTNFEQYTHAQLFDMISGSAPASVSSIANTLNAASTQIQSIADDLNTHITHLQWEGTAGDSFRSWGRQVVQAIDDLAIFHNNAGLAVQTAGDTLSSVKVGMPPVPTADINLVQAYVQQESCKVSNPPTVVKGRVQPAATCLASLPGQISQTDAYAAQTRVDSAHQEAVTQMEKLGGAYNGATQTMDVNTEPQFPPPPAGMMPPRGGGRSSSVGRPTGTGGGTGVTGPSGGGGGTVGGEPVKGKGTHQVPPPPGQPGGISTLQGTQPPTAGPGPVQPPVTPGGSSAGHGPGSGGGAIPPGPGVGLLTPPGSGRGRGRGGVRNGEPLPGEHPVEPGIGAGAVRGGLGGAKVGRLGGRGGEIGGGGLGNGTVEGKAGVIGAEGQGSTTPRSILPAEENAGVRSGVGESTGGTGGGAMMGGGMGGVGGAGGRVRSRSRRPAYLPEDKETWESGATANPAVIE